MVRTNALVIGGGPAGATAARFLAGSGIETVLLERDLSYVKPCGGGMPSTAFDELGIPYDRSFIKSEIGKIRIVSPRGEPLDIGLSGGHLCITERGILDRKLRELAEKSGASVREGEFIRFEQTGRELISVVREKATGEEIKIRSDYVIAADGITSRVASALGLAKPGCLSTISAHIASGLPGRPVEDGVCEFWFGAEHASNFYSWVFPMRGSCSLGTGSSDPKELSGLLDIFMRKRFGTSLRHLAAQNPSWKTRMFKIPDWNGAPFSKGNILFVGDAAGTVMPVTYEGIYYAMKSGEFAARAVAENRPGRYRELWRRRFYKRFLLMSKIRGHLFKNDENIEKWFSLHKNPEVQEIAIRLWLQKKSGESPLSLYINVFKHLLKNVSLF